MPDDAASGRLAANILHFCRALRAAGLPVGTGRALVAIQAAEAAGFDSRDTFYNALRACLVSRAADREVFERAFALFWRDPDALASVLAMMGAGLRIVEREGPEPAGARRAAEGVIGEALRTRRGEETGEEIELDARLTSSAEESLRTRDFEQMTVEEERMAKRTVAELRMPTPSIRSRRLRPSRRGARPDWRASMRAATRAGGGLAPIRMRSPVMRRPDLVALCDISGSMGRYSRMLLHFLHAATHAKDADWGRVHGFVFGTRLTNVSRWLRMRDPDDCLRRLGEAVPDWEGGTRIGSCLHGFNRDWSRRVLSRGAVVLLLTDGLDREDPARLAHEAARLRLSARTLVWLNPLLRWEAFTPRARGVAALLPHVDQLRGGHNVESLEALCRALSRDSSGTGERDRLLRLLRESPLQPGAVPEA